MDEPGPRERSRSFDAEVNHRWNRRARRATARLAQKAGRWSRPPASTHSRPFGTHSVQPNFRRLFMWSYPEAVAVAVVAWKAMRIAELAPRTVDGED